MKNIFDLQVSNDVIGRINKLSPTTQSVWGTMSVGQMLAHCNVAYEMVYDTKHPKAKGLKKFLLKLFVKSAVVSTKPFSKNGRTAPEFVITSTKDFEIEKKRLVAYIQKTQELGANHFHNKESHSFGNLTSDEWNNMFYKHLDHHLQQFAA